MLAHEAPQGKGGVHSTARHWRILWRGVQQSQLEKIWNDMRLGHRFSRKKDDVRAFALSADVFPPNLVKTGASASLTDPIAADTRCLKRVIEFMISKRATTDLVLLFDGRSRATRKIMMEFEYKLAASSAHSVPEI